MIKRNQIFGQCRWTILCCLGLCWLYSCQPQKATRSDRVENAISPKTEIDHAIGFDLIYYQGWKELLLFRHYNDYVDTVRFALVNEQGQAPEEFQAPFVIDLPVESIGALSTTQLHMFELLDATGHLGAVETERYIYSDDIRELVDDGSVIELAPTGKLNLELVINAGIDVLMGVGYPNSQNDDYQTLQRAGVPVILNADWQEKTLLGRAEWIKLLGALIDQEDKANAVFEEIVTSFQETMQLVEEQVDQGPSVITGLAEGDSWYVAGGNSFANHILKVAKVNYPWNDTNATGSLRLDFETVYQEGLKADYWLVPSTAKTLDEIIQADARYEDFRSFQEKQIYNIYARYQPGGGNDYYESAVMAPHIILKDVVKIFHPQLMPEHELVYYNQLK